MSDLNFQIKRSVLLFAKLTIVGLLLPAVRGAEAMNQAWSWKPSLVPKALLVEGLWTDYFRLTPAMHEAGIIYHEAYVSRSPYFGGYTRLFHLPSDEELKAYSVIIISNLDAPSIGAGNLAIRPFARNRPAPISS